MKPFGIALVLVVSAFGCSGTETPQQVPQQTPPQGSAIPSLSPTGEIGCGDCDGILQITPTAVALLDGGRVAVLDSWEPFVRIFDAAGEPIASFGRLGEGPGEMGASLRMARPLPGVWILPWDGGVAVIDIDTTLETFDAAGNFIAQHALTVPMVPVGQAFNAAAATYFRAGFDFAAAGSDPGITRCRFGGAEAVSCDRVPGLEPFLAEAAGPGEPDDLLRAAVIGATPAGGLVVADRSTYRLWVIDAGGDVIVETARDIPRVVKTDEEIEIERERRSRRPGAVEIDPLREYIERGGIGVDGAGRIWVLTQRWTETESVFDVFDDSGAYVGEVGVAAPIRPGEWTVAPFFLRDDRLAAVIQQADGSERVRLWELR